MLNYEITREQWAALEGLAHWIADNSYCRERMPREEYEREEHDRHDKSIRMCFDELDKLQVCFTLQNAVILWAEDWRRKLSEYMQPGLLRRGYSVTVGGNAP